MTNKPSKTNNPKSEFPRIEITIKNIDLRFIQGLLIDFFFNKNSPKYPVFVKFGFSYRRIDSERVQTTYKDFQVVEAVEDPNEPSEVLAEIIMQSYPSLVVVFIEMKRNDKETQEKVIGITKEIIGRMQAMKFNIESVRPVELQPELLMPASTDDEDKASKPKRPEHPQKRSGLNNWFKYFDDCQRKGYKITLREIAKESDYSYGYIRGMYPSYKREHDNTEPDINLTKRPNKI
jgi:hypothetical protein